MRITRLKEMLFHSENFYKIEELTIGGNCGCCGIWVKNIITPINWAVTLCEKCYGKDGDKNVKKNI